MTVQLALACMLRGRLHRARWSSRMKSARALSFRVIMWRRIGGRKLESFDRYAWPLSEDLYVVRSNNSSDWLPLKHSCDPNLWLDGLDFVARRSIAAGESLTADHATFCGPALRAFECVCGSPLCRGTVRPGDHQLLLLRERYGDHVSPYVRQRPTRS